MGLLDDAIREHLELKRRHGADGGEVARQEREILGSSAADPIDADVPAPDTGADDAAAVADPLVSAVPGFDDAPQAEDAGDEHQGVSADELLAGSPLGATEPGETLEAADDIFPATGELLAAGQSADPAPGAAHPEPAAPVRPEPAPSDADSETVARSGARRLSDDELAEWRRRLSERADKLAAERGAAAEGSTPPPAQPDEPTAGTSSFWKSGQQSEQPADPGVPRDFFDAGDAETAFAPEPAPAPEPEADTDVLDETPDFLEETPEHDRMWFEQKPPRDFDFG